MWRAISACERARSSRTAFRQSAAPASLNPCTLRAQPNTRATLVGDSVLPFEISRYAITARTSLRVFRAILEGTYRPNA